MRAKGFAQLMFLLFFYWELKRRAGVVELMDDGLFDMLGSFGLPTFVTTDLTQKLVI